MEGSSRHFVNTLRDGDADLPDAAAVTSKLVQAVFSALQVRVRTEEGALGTRYYFVWTLATSFGG